ncbi:MAG: AraC family transcriptional regulator [Victivallaceae bacterium]|nr:AraC family transcriptional regulator [Victivallaceae bacterium]
MNNYLYFQERGVPIKIHRPGRQDKLSLHAHDFHELVIVFDGEGTHYTLEEKYQISRGDIFLIKPDTQHGYDNTENLKIINLLYLPECLKLALYDLGNSPGYHAFFEVEPALRRQHGFKSRLHLNSGKLEYVMKLVNSMEGELRSGSLGVLFMAVSYFMQLIGFIARSYTKTEIPEQMAILSLAEVVGYIEANYRCRITIAQLAKQASQSEMTLYRMFKKAFNLSPVNYLLSVRIAAAQELLLNSRLNVSEIAGETGFSDSNYFSRIFRKMTGVSPRSYRKNRTNER